MRTIALAFCLFLLPPLATILAYKPTSAAAPAVAIAAPVEDHGIKDGDDALFNND